MSPGVRTSGLLLNNNGKLGKLGKRSEYLKPGFEVLNAHVNSVA